MCSQYYFKPRFSSKPLKSLYKKSLNLVEILNYVEIKMFNYINQNYLTNRFLMFYVEVIKTIMLLITLY